jgi:hypothetical protein
LFVLTPSIEKLPSLFYIFAAMRIGQLARRLGISPSDILGFLGNPDIDANSRLDKETLEKVIGQFAPEKSEVTVEETDVEETPASPSAEEQSTTEESSPEVIRVSKIELQGLKVLGKIDLPAPRKKTEPTTEEQPEQQSNQQPKKESQKEFQRRSSRREREWANPLEARRQQEARDAERRKQESAERQKEKRTNHYYSKVKSVPTKAVRRFEEQMVVEDVEIKEPPKGIFGKFLRWLRS